MVSLLVLFSLLVFVCGSVLQNSTDSQFGLLQETDENVGRPLFLTPLLEDGNIRKARHKSRVKLPDFESMKSFSGYFTVSKECESNLFFWFFPAQEDWRAAPVVLWLQGGPGTSSLLGLFTELGPITFNGTLGRRQYSWNVKNNLLFIDQPVGTGFSFTRKECYAQNGTDVGRDLYSAVVQFYQLFPNLRKNKFYITGQSYAGHYAPSLGYAIHKNNPSAEYKINLSGLMIGNGLMDAMYQVEFSSFLYQLGLVDDRQRDVLQELEKNVVEDLKRQDWESGYSSWRRHQITRSGFLKRVSEYNILKPPMSAEISPWEEFITTPRVRKILHVGSNTFIGHGNSKVFGFLTNNIVQSVKFEVEELLEHYPIVFYHGQLDIICGYPMAVNFFKSLNWSGARNYQLAERRRWYVGDVEEGYPELAAYFKSGHNLHEVLVRAAGHMVPQDQPLWAYELINSVTSSPAHKPLG